MLIPRPLSFFLLLAPLWAQAASTLENALWRVEVEPATLALRVQPAGGPVVALSGGVAKRTVSVLQQSASRLQWQWNAGAYRLELELKERDLLLSVHAKAAGELQLLRQPAAALGRGMILPLAEGHYVPAGDAVWRKFLLDLDEFNTSQDMSLPMWGLDHGAFSLSWLMVNPFNNRVKVARDGDGVGLTLSHEFVSLAPATPMSLILHLGGADPLAGAKRYRDWLVAEGRFESLKEKIARSPEGAKLLGASHAYLWGGGLLAPADVKDWPGFLAVLRGDGALPARLRGYFDREAGAALADVRAVPERYQQRLLVDAVNAALTAVARESWQTAAPDAVVMAGRYGELRGEVARTFGRSLTPEPGAWGGGVSVATMKKIRKAGLPRLWLGLGEGWEGGLWHPEAVGAGVEAGYLVAPYDSYETALKPGSNPDWATAHLGEKVYRDCAIVLKGGLFKAGFQKSGRYTDPHCVRPVLQARVRAVAAKAGFNSWFLDAYATGMVYDSYRAEAPLTQSQNAAGSMEASRWISDALKLPTGSEDGNGPTAQGILFAHGMQTPVVGWGDKDMQKDKNSPYFLGSWFPAPQPTVFFRQVPLKEALRAIHFNPATRLPLYQAVFHGSVVTTNHWLFDSLKFANVRGDSELAQLLYNVPPLYHLSGDTLEQRLPIMKRQDAFFRPLHQRLATEPMTAFNWLSSDRLLQETRFGDGTRLIANFGDKDQQLDGRRLLKRSVTAINGDGSSTVYVAAGE
ncbi:glycoside hydrolase [Janthinobacterium fluminis]|uniref:Glycoside hydrolase n=1 Tax=Janthinobacterium fluminis TaxID=2987524 RepID=A0ABT5K4S4_9BURK|nr:glycoside hydrolase [Janthinobacterium fluminis]MDC8760006.1 glycoside hydrolase [Janthinobacterium fluminis]